MTYAEATLATGPSPRAGVFWTDRGGRSRWAIAIQVGVSSMSSIGMLVACPPVACTVGVCWADRILPTPTGPAGGRLSLQHIGDRRFEGLGLSGEVVVEGAKPDVGLVRARVNA